MLEEFRVKSVKERPLSSDEVKIGDVVFSPQLQELFQVEGKSGNFLILQNRGSRPASLLVLFREVKLCDRGAKQ